MAKSPDNLERVVKHCQTLCGRPDGQVRQAATDQQFVVQCSNGVATEADRLSTHGPSAWLPAQPPAQPILVSANQVTDYHCGGLQHGELSAADIALNTEESAPTTCLTLR